MTTIDCKSCHEHLPDLLLDAGAAPLVAREHLAQCADCQAELQQLQATMALMDAWSAPEPSGFFDVRLKARLRSEEAPSAQGLWQRIRRFTLPESGRGLRPAMVGALGVVMLLGGGTAATWLAHHHPGTATSPTVNDLKIYDNNAQAVTQMDILDDAASVGEETPQS